MSHKESWKVKKVSHAGVCYNPETGSPRAAECFKVHLASTPEELVIDVELTMLAAQEIDHRFGAQKSSLPERNRLAEESILSFVEYYLERGWDPKAGQRLVLNADAVNVVVARWK